MGVSEAWNRFNLTRKRVVKDVLEGYSRLESVLGRLMKELECLGEVSKVHYKGL